MSNKLTLFVYEQPFCEFFVKYFSKYYCDTIPFCAILLNYTKLTCNHLLGDENLAKEQLFCELFLKYFTTILL